MLNAQSLENMKFMTEEYPPYNFTKDGKPTGIAVELLVEIFKKIGLKKSHSDIEVTKWARGVKSINEKPGTCLFATNLTKERKDILGWKFVYPIPQVSEESDNHLIARKGKGIKFNSEDDIKKYGKKIGVVRGDVGASFLTEVGISQGLIDAAADPDLMVKKMEKGRYDVISYGHTTAKTVMKKNGMDPDQFEIVYTFPNNPLGYAFHKGTDPGVLEKFQKALDELNSDGTSEKIRQKFLK